MSSCARLFPLLVAVSVAGFAAADDQRARVTTELDPVRVEVADSALTAEGVAVTLDRQAFDMSWWSVDGGGGESTGGLFTLTAAIGQPESGTAWACDQVLDAGLWSAVIDFQPLFCDGFETGNTTHWSNTVP